MGTFSGGNFHAEIAACHHDAVGNLQNLFEVLDSLRLFELGDDRSIAFGGGDDLFDCADIGGSAHERDRHRIDAGREPEGEVFLVLAGERRQAEDGARQIDPLMLAQQSSIDHLTDHVIALHLENLERDAAVGEKDSRAGLDLASQRLKGGAQALGGAFNRFIRDSNAGAGDQLHRGVIAQRAGADLGALQILQDADRALQLRGHLAQCANPLQVLVMAAVRKIEAGHIHPEQQQLANPLLAA